MEATCETCRFFRELTPDGFSNCCMRYPPKQCSVADAVLITLMHGWQDKDVPVRDALDLAWEYLRVEHAVEAELPRYPEVSKHLWCGEHQPRETEPTQ
jgi:hypothetical protein